MVFLQYLQLASQDLAAIWQKKRQSKILLTNWERFYKIFVGVSLLINISPTNIFYLCFCEDAFDRKMVFFSFFSRDLSGNDIASLSLSSLLPLRELVVLDVRENPRLTRIPTIQLPNLTLILIDSGRACCIYEMEILKISGKDEEFGKLSSGSIRLLTITWELSLILQNVWRRVVGKVLINISPANIFPLLIRR